jgi:hypothetical protein
MPNNKCPFCGAEMFATGRNRQESITCGTIKEDKTLYQSRHCELIVKCRRLVEAAKAAIKCYDNRTIVGINPVFEELRKAVLDAE